MKTDAIRWDHIADECGMPVSDVEQIGEGWDTFVFRANRDLVFKLSKREGVFGQLATEMEVLRLIEGRLPARTSSPVTQVGESQAWPFGYAVQQWVGGVPLSADLSACNDTIAREIGNALRSVHSIDVSLDQRESLPLWNYREDSGDYVGPALRKAEKRMSRSSYRALLGEAERVLDNDSYFQVEPSLIHNDLHAEHVLLQGAGALAIIDWGDAGMGDPDTDFLMLYSALGVEFLEPCVSAYGHRDPEGLVRKLDDLSVLSMLFLIEYAPRYGSEEDEAFGWEELEGRFGDTGANG